MFGVCSLVARTTKQERKRYFSLPIQQECLTGQPTTTDFPICVSCTIPQGRIKKISTFLTVRSELALSLLLTARITPDLHGNRATSPISGGSSPLTQRNRFPTSSGRASTAMAFCWSKPLGKLPNNDDLTDVSFMTLKWPLRIQRYKGKQDKESCSLVKPEQPTLGI